MTTEIQTNPHLDSRPPYPLIGACIVLLVLLFVAQSVGPGRQAAVTAARQLSLPMMDIQIATALYQSQNSVSSTEVLLSDLLRLTYRELGLAIPTRGSFEVSARYILLSQALEQAPDPAYRRAEKNLRSNKDSYWKDVRPILAKRLGRWDAKDAQTILSTDFGPAGLLAAERVYSRLNIPDKTDDTRQKLRNLGELGSMKMQFLIATLLFMGFGGVSAWAVYWTISSKTSLNPPEPLEQPAGSQPYWETLAIFLSLHVLLSLAIVIVANTIPIASKVDDDVLSIFGYVLSAVVTLPFGAARLRRYDLSLRSIGWQSQDWILDIGWGLGGFFAATSLTLAVSLIITMVLNQLGVTQEQNPAASFFLTKQFGWPTVLILIVLAVVAPILEETFFRGALLKGIWLEKGTTCAIWLSSIAFAAMHPGAVTLALPYVALGFVFARLTLIRKSLVPAMIAHGLNNLLFSALTMLMQF